MTSSSQLFPCPVCITALQVRKTKKNRPYVICDPCGVQMFVRNDTGIRKFHQLLSDAQQKNVWQRLENLQERYQKKCPECGKKFWASLEGAKTSWFDGELIGYRCPEPGCDGVVKDEGGQ